MNRKTTDRIVKVWAAKFLLGPPSLIALAAAFMGYLFPNSLDTAGKFASGMRLDWLVLSRVDLGELHATSYWYWLCFFLLLPLNIAWLHLTGLRANLLSAIKAISQSNLTSRIWDPEKYSLNRGHIQFSLTFLLTLFLLFVALTVNVEPSFCKGCEQSYLAGFILVNWLGTHLMLLACYYCGSVLCLWKSIRLNFGENNE